MENSEKSLPVSQQWENQCFRNARNRPKSGSGCTIGWGVGGLPPVGGAGAPQCSLCDSQTISGCRTPHICGVTFQKVDERGLEPMPTPESPPNVALPSDESLRAELNGSNEDAYHPPAEPFCYAHLSQKNNGSNEDGDNVRDLWLRARKCSIEGYTVPLYKNNMLQENNTPDLLQENNTLRETVAKVQQVAESNARLTIWRNAELQRLFNAERNKELEAAKAEVLSLMRARDEARKDHFAALEAGDVLRQKRNDAVSELNAELDGISVIRKEFGAKENETFYDFVHRLADDGESRLLEIGRLIATKTIKPDWAFLERLASPALPPAAPQPQEAVLDQTKDALADARDKALEEAAKVCDGINHQYTSSGGHAAERCAAAIRSLQTNS